MEENFCCVLSSGYDMLPRFNTYHSDFQRFDVELPDLPVAQNVANDFNKSIDPEDGRHDEKENVPTVVLNPAEKQRRISHKACCST